jgi:hypothetical protein
MLQAPDLIAGQLGEDAGRSVLERLPLFQIFAIALYEERGGDPDEYDREVGHDPPPPVVSPFSLHWRPPHSLCHFRP